MNVNFQPSKVYRIFPAMQLGLLLSLLVLILGFHIRRVIGESNIWRINQKLLLASLKFGERL